MRGARPERALDAVVRAAVRLPERGATLIAAVSGGPDSVALASVLERLSRSLGFVLVLGHVNHGVRASADQDECVVLSVGARLGCRVETVALEPGRDDEASLRAARYEALAAIARRLGAAHVATAHTAEDQTETVLLALFRGTGLAGLAGIAAERPLAGVDAGVLLRPLLRATHDDLLSELRRSGLPYARDPSNDTLRYRRNAVRASLVSLRRDFPALDRSVARCAEIVRAELAGDARALARRRVRHALRERGDLRDVPFERIEAVLDARPGRRVFVKPGIDLPTGDA